VINLKKNLDQQHLGKSDFKRQCQSERSHHRNQTITLNGGTSGGQGTYLGSDSRHSFQGTLLVNGFLYSRAATGGIIAPGATVNLGATGTLDPPV
jgi:hypothetical protein